MANAVALTDRRTATDVVFDKLYTEIMALELLPGTKLSEAEVARQFGVSRQPVRDAFNRLDQRGLLLIRPQRATEVRGFSRERIAHARFVRLAIELEVVRRACAGWDERKARTLDRNLVRQRKAITSGHLDAFHAHDREFHRLICELGGLSATVETIEECKQEVDRLCVLSLGRDREAATLLEDHHAIADALRRGDVDEATAMLRQHLGRLDETIEEVQRAHSDYFSG